MKSKGAVSIDVNANTSPNREHFAFENLRQMVGLPSLSSSSNRYSFTKDEVQNALENQDAVALRKMSNYFFYNSGAYRRLVEYFGGILTNDFVVVPPPKTKRLDKKMETVQTYFRSADPRQVCPAISLNIVKEGVYFGYEREIGNTYTLQQLPSEYCRSRFKMGNLYVVEFDFSYFDTFRKKEEKDLVLASFPDEFTPMYAAYEKDKNSLKWQILNPDHTRAHLLSSPLPMLASTFPDLIELEEYKRIDKARSELDIYKIIVQRIPTNKDGEIELYMEEIEDLHRNARVMVSNSNVDVLTTPCEMIDINLTDKATQSRDDVERANNAIYATAGTSTVLFTDASRATSTGLTLSVNVDESLMFPLLAQYQVWYENRLRLLTKDDNFKVVFPPLSQYNRNKMADLYKTGATLGFPTRLLSMAALGINQFDMEALLEYEIDVLRLQDRMIPTSSAYNPTDNEGGRPESTEPLTDEGEATKDGDKNKE